MSAVYDVAVIGLGATGSSAAFHLARRGASVIGFDRFSPPHGRAPDHQATRLLTLSTPLGDDYLGLLQRSLELWHELAESARTSLFRRTGGLTLGLPEGRLVSACKRTADMVGAELRILTAAQTRVRFPALNPDEDMVAIWDPGAGILFAEACVAAHLELARAAGADVRFDSPVASWEATDSGVRILAGQEEIEAERVLVAAGAWLPDFFPDLALELIRDRIVTMWFDPLDTPEDLVAESFPICRVETGQSMGSPSEGHEIPLAGFSCLPDLGEGVKFSLHYKGSTDGGLRDRDVETAKDREVEAARRLLGRYIPVANGALRRSSCLTTLQMPGTGILLDFHPSHDRVLIASPCSGRGFKFSAAAGELLAAKLMDEEPVVDARAFGFDRLRDVSALSDITAD